MVAVISVLIIAGSGVIFAQRNGNHHQQRMPNSQPRMHTMQHGEYRGDRAGNTEIKVGTVVSVDEKSNILTVKDADGETFKVFVTPIAKLIDVSEMMEKREERRDELQEARENGERPARDSRPQNQREVNTIELTDVTIGDWITVHYLDTDTDTLEATRIGVVKN